MTEQEQHYPVPEFIKGAKGAGWRIEDSRSTGQVNTRPGILHVPLDMACPMCGKAHSHAARNHEVTHANITLDKHGRMPVLPHGLKNEYFQAVEDLRIWQHVDLANARLHGSSVVYDLDGNYERDENGNYVRHNPPVLCEAERVKWEAVYKGLDDKGRVLFACAAGASDEAFVEDIVRKCTPPEATLDADSILKLRQEVSRILLTDVTDYGKTPPIRNTYRAAAFLQNLLEPPPSEADKKPDPNTGSDPADEKKAQEREEKGEGEELREATEEEAQAEKEKHENRYGSPDGSEGSGWYEMEIDEPPLGRHLPGRLVARYQSADEGTFIRRPDRLWVDQKVFGKKHRITGGGVLIDDSGSMGLGLEEILLILESAPGATIGVYSSDHMPGGMLRIVARDGKTISDPELAHTPGGDNGVDGPALEWLGSLPFTRKVWISDGQVTGKRGSFMGASLVVQRDILLKKHNIAWVNPHIHGRDKMAELAANVLAGRRLLAKKGA